MEPTFADIPVALWRRVARLLPRDRLYPMSGRPRFPYLAVLAGIVHRLRTCYQWQAIPDHVGSGSTCHLRMQQWARGGDSGASFKSSCRITTNVERSSGSGPPSTRRS